MENFGKLGRDRVTGFEEVIIAMGIHLSGCSTLALAPRAKEGEKRNSQWFDMERIEIVGEGIAADLAKSEKPGNANEKLGKIGKDKINDFQGVIVAKIINLYGSDGLALEAKAKDGKCELARVFDEGRIEILDEGGIAAEEVRASKPGGVDLGSPDDRDF